MIAILGASAIALSMLQASVAGPTTAFRGCLKDAAVKATGDKVGGDKIEDYLKTACSVQMNALTSAIVAFETKNGTSKKTAASDAAMSIDDYISTPADNYKFSINYTGPTAAATPPQPASSQPH